MDFLEINDLIDDLKQNIAIYLTEVATPDDLDNLISDTIETL